MTPVHDQSYRHYEGRRQPPGRAWTVIMNAGVRAMLSRKPFIALLIASWVPFLVRSVQIYAVTAYPQARQVLPVDAKMFENFIEFQGLFGFFVTIYAGAGLVANDRRANALQVYLSKPLLRMEYIAGKLGVLVIYLAGVTLVPAILLVVMEIALSGSLTFVRENPAVVPAVLLASLVRVLVGAFAMLALSAMSKSARYVAVHVHGRHVLHRSDVRRPDIRHRIHARGVGVGHRQLRRRVRLGVPSDAALRDARARLGARARGPGRGLDLHPRTPGAWRGDRDMTEAATTVLSADHVSKWYGQIIGLNDVTVNVPAGITGLLGPNGAGKSTFMKLITGQLRPSKGAVRVLGEPIWGNPALYFRIGFCPEQDAFYDRMTGIEWVQALVRLNGLSESASRQAAERALAAVDLIDVAGKRIGAYSKGMRQRVKLAQAIVHDPELLILDEPLSGMDPVGRRRTIRMIRDWGKQGKSILVSSHILHEVESMTSNILLINNGRILAEGNVHQIRDLIDEHPHTVHIRAADPHRLAREFLSRTDIISMRFEPGALTVETGTPDAFYAGLTELVASGAVGAVEEVTSPDDNLQAVFKYLVKT